MLLFALRFFVVLCCFTASLGLVSGAPSWGGQSPVASPGNLGVGVIPPVQNPAEPPCGGEAGKGDLIDASFNAATGNVDIIFNVQGSPRAVSYVVQFSDSDEYPASDGDWNSLEGSTLVVPGGVFIDDTYGVGTRRTYRIVGMDAAGVIVYRSTKRDSVLAWQQFARTRFYWYRFDNEYDEYDQEYEETTISPDSGGPFISKAGAIFHYDEPEYQVVHIKYLDYMHLQPRYRVGRSSSRQNLSLKFEGAWPSSSWVIDSANFYNFKVSYYHGDGGLFGCDSIDYAGSRI